MPPLLSRRPRLLLLGGSRNQTTQMHQVALELPECEAVFSPYYADGLVGLARRAGLLEFTVLGRKHRQRCLDYLRQHALAVDEGGRGGRYDLVLTCSDLLVQRNLRGRRVVLVQEGILDPPSFGLALWRRFPFLPRWLGGTATTGLSLAYERFCVASEGYREHFLAEGLPAERLVVTGIPNFDDCRRYLDNDFARRGYVLVCTSDARETLKADDRRAFVERALRIAAGRPLIFKLHPNENAARARRELLAWAPAAEVYATGSAEQMIANCDVLVTQWSSTAFVGLALGKEVHSSFGLDELRRLQPVQNGCAARNIAQVCRELLTREAPAAAGLARLRTAEA